VEAPGQFVVVDGRKSDEAVGEETSGEAGNSSGLARQIVFRVSGSECGAGRSRRVSPVDACGDQTGVATGRRWLVLSYGAGPSAIVWRTEVGGLRATWEPVLVDLRRPDALGFRRRIFLLLVRSPTCGRAPHLPEGDTPVQVRGEYRSDGTEIARKKDMMRPVSINRCLMGFSDQSRSTNVSGLDIQPYPSPTPQRRSLPCSNSYRFARQVRPMNAAATGTAA
jgi:hypothetical protein